MTTRGARPDPTARARRACTCNRIAVAKSGHTCGRARFVGVAAIHVDDLSGELGLGVANEPTGFLPSGLGDHLKTGQS